MSTGSFNPEKQLKRTPELSVSDLYEGIVKNDRSILSQAITLIESQHKSHRNKANALITKIMPLTGNSFRMGITGVPGVGKSTFIETFGKRLVAQGHQVAVLAVDPSSDATKGSILGDKTRMADLSKDKRVFIRPSPAADALGGVARKTRENIMLCEAAGYDFIMVETVGVGQSETTVRSMVDLFLLLLLPGAGDELQGIKRGIVEMADILAINKADGASEKLAKQAQIEYKNALHLYPPNTSGWSPPVLLCSGLHAQGLEPLLKTLIEYKSTTIKNGYFASQRQKQNEHWFKESILDALKFDFYTHPLVKKSLESLRHKVSSNQISPFDAASQLLAKYQSQEKP